MNTARLTLDLFCLGLRLDASCDEEDGRGIRRNRAGLGSGLELRLPGARKDHWINAPVTEPFAAESPLVLMHRAEDAADAYRIVDERTGEEHAVRLPETPAWYSRTTSSGVQMSDVGVLQGTYLGVYVGPKCGFWAGAANDACKFCISGLNVGEEKPIETSVEDVVETALAAKEESGVTFVHMNAGYQGENSVDLMRPFVKALKDRVGVLVGVQTTPARDLWRYDRLKEDGADHLSFCYEFHDPKSFAELCPGKSRALGHDAYFNALEYCSKIFGRGSCSGEIIAGVEPLEATLKAIDFICSLGAFPTVCVFRPTDGSQMENVPPPDPAEMEIVMKAVWESCRKHLIPIGMAPNIEVSLIMNPVDAGELVASGPVDLAWRAALATARFALKPVFSRRMTPRQPDAV